MICRTNCRHVASIAPASVIENVDGKRRLTGRRKAHSGMNSAEMMMCQRVQSETSHARAQPGAFIYPAAKYGDISAASDSAAPFARWKWIGTENNSVHFLPSHNSHFSRVHGEPLKAAPAFGMQSTRKAKRMPRKFVCLCAEYKR